MSDIRFIKAPLEIDFEEIKEERYEEVKKEYDKLSELEDDSVGQWLKMAKARGETQESDRVFLTLLVDLHRKVDELTRLVKHEEKVLLELEKGAQIESIGYEHFKLEKPMLEKDKKYYGRISIPVFPKRDIPVFFIAQDDHIAKLELIHERDAKDWNAYITARERIMIREMKRGAKQNA